MKKFWSMKKTSNNIGEIKLYGQVSEYSWWGDDVTPKKFRDDLDLLGDVDEIKVRLNSPGGDVFAGLHIYSLLKEHSATVTVVVEGLAASIATIIAMAGDKILMPKGSMFMIHNPWTYAAGEANDLRQTADILDSIRAALVEVYVAKTGKEESEIISLLDSETWFTSAQAVEAGFADAIEQELQISACLQGKTATINGVAMDWSKYTDAPELPPLNQGENEEKTGALQKVKAILSMNPNPVAPINQPQNNITENGLTLEQFKDEYPAIFAVAVTQGTEQERNRIKALDELSALPSAASIIAKAKYETGSTAETVAVDLLKAEQDRIKNAGMSRQNDSDTSGLKKVLAGVSGFDESADTEDKQVSGIANAFKKIRGVK